MLDTITAINTLSVLKATRQSEIDAIALAVSILDGTWQGQYAEGEAAKAQVVDLTTQLDSVSAEKVNLNAQVVSLQGELDTANTSIADLSTTVASLQPADTAIDTITTDPVVP